MAKIVPNQRFLDGTDAFEEGEEYDVPDNKAYYFAMNGWLAATDLEDVPEGTVGPKVAPETNGEAVDLQVDKGAHGQRTSDL